MDLFDIIFASQLANVDSSSYASLEYVDAELDKKLGKDESAISADKLTNKITVLLGGDVISSPVQFDGSTDLTITTQIGTISNTEIDQLFDN